MGNYLLPGGMLASVLFAIAWSLVPRSPTPRVSVAYGFQIACIFWMVVVVGVWLLGEILGECFLLSLLNALAAFLVGIPGMPTAISEPAEPGMGLTPVEP